MAWGAIGHWNTTSWSLSTTRPKWLWGVCGSNTDDQSGQGGSAFPPRSQPYPMLPEGETYLFQRLKSRMAPAGYHFIHEPNGRATRPYDGRPACSGNNNCMPVCPIGAMYSGDQHAQHAQDAGARLFTDSTVWKLEKGVDDKIVAAHVRSSKGVDTRLTAKYFIVAAHGLETAKTVVNIGYRQQFRSGGA